MAATEPDLAELHQAAISGRLAEVYVAMPGTVISYDAATQTAKVRPGVNRTVFDEEDNPIEEVIPPFENVPVIFFRCASFSIHANLVAGDCVRLVFCSDGTTEWRQGQIPQVAPGDLKRLGLSYPTCDPGFFPNTNTGQDLDESIGIPDSPNARLHFNAEEGILAGGGSASVALANLVDAQLNTLKSAISGAAVVAGDGGASFKAAIVAALAAWPGAIASSNLKAD